MLHYVICGWLGGHSTWVLLPELVLCNGTIGLMIHVETSARTTPSSGQCETANNCAHAISVLARRIEGYLGGEPEVNVIVI